MYYLDKSKFKIALTNQGYKNISDFAKRTGMSRQTITHLLSGKKSVFTYGLEALLKKLDVNPFELVTEHYNEEVVTQNISNVVTVLEKKFPDCAVVLIGSRATGQAKKYSDWDLGITCGPTRLSSLEYLKIKSLVQDLAETGVEDIDIMNLDQAPPWFLAEIKNPKLLGGNAQAYIYLKGVLHGVGQTQKN